MKALRRMAPTQRAEAIAVVASIFMAAGMIWVAVLSGSVAVMAEGIDTCVDIVTSVAVMIGLKLSQRRSADFPYGLYKIENVVTVAIGGLILYSAYELARESISRLMSAPEPITNPVVAMATMAVVAVVTGLLAWNKGRVGRQENSPSLMADSRHSWTDAMASAGIVVGVGLDALGVAFVDSLMALVIAAILAWSGVQLLLNALKVLLDAAIEPDVLELATTTAAANPGVRRVVGVEGRNSGSYRFLRLTLVPQAHDLPAAEACAGEVEASVKAVIQNVESVQVELVADSADTTVIAVLLEADGSTVARDVASTRAYSLLTVDPAGGPAAKGSSVVDRPRLGAGAEPEIGLVVAIARHGANAVVVGADVPPGGPRYVLDANAIAVLPQPELRTLTEVEAAAAVLVDECAGRVGELESDGGPGEEVNEPPKPLSREEQRP